MKYRSPCGNEAESALKKAVMTGSPLCHQRCELAASSKWRSRDSIVRSGGDWVIVVGMRIPSMAWPATCNYNLHKCQYPQNSRSITLRPRWLDSAPDLQFPNLPAILNVDLDISVIGTDTHGNTQTGPYQVRAQAKAR